MTLGALWGGLTARKIPALREKRGRGDVRSAGCTAFFTQ
jgi:hypothetical protein